MQTRGLKNRRMEGQMDGQTLFYRNLPTTTRSQTNLQNASRIKGTCHFGQIGANRNSFGEKNNVFDVPMVVISEESCYNSYRES